MSPQIRLSRHQLVDLMAIREIGQEGLQRLATALKTLPPAPARAADLHAVILQNLAGERQQADALLRQLLALHGVVRQLNLTSSQVFDGIRDGIQSSDLQWNAKEIQQWETVAPNFQAIFELEVVQLSAKALDLSYEHAELLQRARIVTDIRPVFDRDANEIAGSVVSQTLLIRYDDSEGNHVLSLAIDENDIELLIKQCERALKKSVTIRKRLQDANIPMLIPGSDDE